MFIIVELSLNKQVILLVSSTFISFTLKDAYAQTAKLLGDVGMGQQVNMALTEGLMSARLNARPGPQIDREEVKRYTACIN